LKLARVRAKGRHVGDPAIKSLVRESELAENDAPAELRDGAGVAAKARELLRAEILDRREKNRDAHDPRLLERWASAWSAGAGHVLYPAMLKGAPALLFSLRIS
jgi:hypothetical protein